jgi:Type I restriction enzyme R protein N terminus (HSDR_N)
MSENDVVTPELAGPINAQGAAGQRRATSRAVPKWETDARERLRTAVRRFARPLSELAARDANEGDTRLLVTDFLGEGFGFDKYTDLTTEYQVKGEFADFGVRIDRELIAFIEVKRVATKLAPKHLRQVEMYAVNEGVEWVILTNGAMWQVYHLTGGLPVVIDRRQIDELWRAKRATSPQSLAGVLASEPVVEEIRKELRRQTGHNVDPAELVRLLRGTVVRPDCLA